MFTAAVPRPQVPGQEDLRSWPAGGIDVKGRRPAALPVPWRFSIYRGTTQIIHC